jgi:hypothetical protein
MKGLGRAVAVGLLAAFAGVTWLALFYVRFSTLRFDLDVTPPGRLVQGLYPVEREPATDRTFAWTGETMTIALPDLDRQADWTMDLRVRAARSAGIPNPELTFYIDGVQVMTRPSTLEYEDVRVPIPARPSQSGLTVSMLAKPTFVPGPKDARALGVMLDRIEIAPNEIVIPPSTAFAGVALASAAAGAAIGLLGATAGSAVLAAILLTAGLAALVAFGAGPYTEYPLLAARTSAWVGLASVLLATIVRRLRGQSFRNTAKFAIAFSAATLLLELLALVHPNMRIGDTLFHAHRFQEVLAGHLYFTSIAPGGYQFPYAPGLYLVAWPFAGLVRRGLGDMTLLRAVVCAADALAGLLLYNMAVHARGDRLAGALAVALYHLIPLGFGVVATGNMTNAFAQSLCVAALAVTASPSLRIEHRPMVGLLTIALAAAFLSHTSAFAIAALAAGFIAICFWWRGGPALRSPAIAVLVAFALALVFAIVVYYAHFMETYRSELGRIGSETASAAPDAGGRGIGERLAAVPRYLYLYFGVPALVLAAWGVVLLWQRGARDRVTLSAAGWAMSCGVFLAIGILTPVDMRYYLAAIPVVAFAAAMGASIAWAAGGAQRIAAGALLAWTVVVGVHSWWSALG